jgi:F-type H+-transporting ATPase subunit b
MTTLDSDRLNCRIQPLGVAVIVPVIISLLFLIGTASAAAAGEPATKGWVDTDWFRALNFIVLAAGLFFILRKPFSQTLRSRIAGIKQQLADLEAQKAEAEKRLAEYNEKLVQLEKEAERIVAEYVKQGHEAKARILKEAEEAAEKLQSHARHGIENEFEKAKKQLQMEILENSLTKAAEVIKDKITAEDQDRLIDEYLEKVVA